MKSVKKGSPVWLVLTLGICVVAVILLNFKHLQRVLDHHDEVNPIIDDRPLNIQDKFKKPSMTHNLLRQEFDGTKQETVHQAFDDVSATESEKASEKHKVAGLNCDAYGGPSEEIAAEMVYWRDIPTDVLLENPYHKKSDKKLKFLTFEPDEGGWNNIRMSMETAMVVAHAMGRILVLPPTQQMYLLNKDVGKNNQFTFASFFHLSSIREEYKDTFQVWHMKKFLNNYQFYNRTTHEPALLPNDNRTNWNGMSRKNQRELWLWLRQVTKAPVWNFDKCVVVIPNDPNTTTAQIETRYQQYLQPDFVANTWHRIRDYYSRPTNVDAPPEERFQELLAHRQEVCVYDKKLHDEPVLHFMGDNASGARLLVHFYAYLLFENYHLDLWSKRFVRDHLRYIDEIQCAAARVVYELRQKAKTNRNVNGDFDTFHIRRGDFQYKQTRIEATEIYENTKDLLRPNATIFIATDERNMTFFDPLREHYNLYFLHDFKHLIPDLNANFYGMLDQRIASRGRIFIGAYFSTFTGYINRMRGYHSQKDKAEGYENGILQSYYYVEMKHKYVLKAYAPISPPLWAREFPIGWRDIDHDVPNLDDKSTKT